MKYLVLLFIAALAAAPYGTGMLIERQYNTAIFNLNKAYEGQITFVGNFKKGYIDSHATTQITNMSDKHTITLQHSIHNGPIILNFKNWLDVNSYIPQGYKLALIDTTLEDNWSKMLQGFYKQGQALKITTVLGYNGDGVTSVVNDPLTMPMGSGVLKWGGLNIELKHDKDFTNFNVEVKAPSINYKEDAASGSREASIADIHFSLIQQIITMHVSGQGSFNNLSLKDGDVEIVTLNKATMDFKGDTVNKLSSTEANYSFDKLKIEEHIFGPFGLNFKLKNINSEALNTLSKNRATKSATIAPEQFNALFSSKPQADFNLNFQTPKGMLTVVSSITVDGKPIQQVNAQSLKATIISNTSMVFDEMVFYATLSYFAKEELKNMEIAFATKNPNAPKNPFTLSDSEMQAKIEAWMMLLLDQLRNNNWIVEKNQKIFIEIKLENDVFTVNGVAKTDDDWKKLQPFLSISVEQIPAPETHLQPEIVPVQPEQQPAPTQSQTDPAPAPNQTKTTETVK